MKSVSIFLTLVALAFLVCAVKFGTVDRRREADSAYALTNGNANQGRELIEKTGCGSCHEIGGVHAAHGKIGPSLKTFRTQAMIAGVMANTPENLKRWLKDPRKVDAATAMPDLELTDVEVRDIAAYLYSSRAE